MTGDDHPEHPSTEEAYGFVAQSYDWMLRRFEAVNGRLQNTVSILVTLPLLAIPLIEAAVDNVSFASGWFVGALSVFFAAAVVGMGAMYWSGLTLMDPKTIHENYLDLPPSDFKREMLRRAGKHFERNLFVVGRKADVALGLLAALVAGAALLVVWVCRST